MLVREEALSSGAHEYSHSPSLKPFWSSSLLPLPAHFICEIEERVSQVKVISFAYKLKVNHSTQYPSPLTFPHQLGEIFGSEMES
jgi:hypothetical protein